MKPLRLLAVMIALGSLSAFAQTQPCPSGTLANLLGTSCAIGHLTFNFQNNFQGSIVTQDIFGNVQTIFFPPSAIGFTPVQTGNQAGFLLTANFFDNTNGSGLIFSQHNASFSYGPQVIGAFEILGESSTLSGNIADVTSFSNDGILGFDGRCFNNGQCMSVQPIVSSSPQNGSVNNPFVSSTLGIPALFGITAPTGFTTEVDSFAIGGGEATLNSALFLYTVASQTPLPPPASLQYENIDLPSEAFTSAIGINNSGDIGGTATDFSGGTHAYLKDHNGKLTLIDFPGAAETFLSGINDRDDVVGLYVDSAGVVHGFSFIDGTFATVDAPNSMFNSADGINDPGAIAGFFQSLDFGVHGYRLKDADFTVIDDPNAFPGSNGFPTFTEIFSINNRGQVVGLSTDMFGLSHSFLLSDGVFQRIDVPAAVEGTAANGLNELDQVVGQFTDINLNTHGFLLTNNVFNTVDFPGATTTAPAQINSSGLIVGTYADSSGNPHGFLAVPGPQGGNDLVNNAGTVAPQSGPQSGDAPPKPSIAPRPCSGRQPIKLNSTRMTCSPVQ